MEGIRHIMSCEYSLSPLSLVFGVWDQEGVLADMNDSRYLVWGRRPE